MGSGKSTLLFAVEFALFGLSDLKGSHLLSEGKREGHVEVTFLADGREYVVRRGLRKRGDDVVQEDCCISAGGARENLAPSDLKQRVVAILGFNEPTHPRAESLVYRYAIFTPQEQMKEILLQNVEMRFHVLRRVLGVQSYQTAADNSLLVARKVAEMSYGLKKASSDLEEARADLADRTSIMADLDTRLPGLEKSEADETKLVDQLDARWRQVRDQREELKEITGRIPILEGKVSGLKSEESEATDARAEIDARLLAEIDPKVASFDSMARPPRTSEAVDHQFQKARDELVGLREKKAALEAKLSEARELVSKGVCPVCGQSIPPSYERSNHLEQESDEVSKDLSGLETLVSELEAEADYAKRFEEEQRTVEVLLKERSGIEKEAARLDAKAARARQELLEARSQLEAARLEVSSVSKLSESLAALEEELTGARQRAKEASRELTRARTRREEVSKERDRLAKTVASKEAIRSRAGMLGGYESWLRGFFLPTIGMIEEQTLAQANASFNGHFQRFFTTLVDDRDMAVRVREDFSPVFERQGFEQDFEALSGGERTSMALAYRFALNAVVREDISAKTELVILDEPTDGFSKEQVYKMRDLLEELDAKQVILVSHEKELESMSDHIFYVTKSNGTSRVSRS